MIDSANYRVPEELKGTILEEIVVNRLAEIEGAKTKLPEESLRMALGRPARVRSLRQALMRRPGIIAELKKASPSAGLLRSDFNYRALADVYVRAGAAAISIVTESRFFKGSLETIAALRWSTDVPLLRKDFIVDPYQVVEARHAGADAVLLIAALLDAAALRDLLAVVEELGMDALVEVHSEAEVERASSAGAVLIGVNSRDLRSFKVSLEVCVRLAALLPGETVSIAESGIRTAEDIRQLASAGFRGFLIGEALMRASSPGATLTELLSALPARQA